MIRLYKLDWILIMSSLLLLAVGLLGLYSISVFEETLSGTIFMRQIVFALISFIVLIVFSFIDHDYYKRNSTFIYFATLALLGLVLVIGKTVRGTAGWIGVGTFHVQPAEIAKLALIIFLASFISKKKSELGGSVRLVASMVLAGVMIFLVLRQPDFGSAMILVGIWLGMTLISGINKKHLTALVFLGGLLATTSWFFMEPYQKSRIVNFIRPENDPRGSGYNVIQSIIAVGSGGITGKGIGNGSQTQLNFLPEKHTDFIFAMTAEALGLAGSLFLFGLFGILLYRIRRIALQTEENFGFLVASGVFIMIFLQVFINIGMNIGLMPVTGIPLPFLSYGGSSLITNFAAIGILVNINLRKKFNTGF